MLVFNFYYFLYINNIYNNTMADYELSILRNTTPVDSREEAIAILDSFEGHMIGQPISILYKDIQGKIKVLFAVGKKNVTDIEVGYPICGEDFYDIIGEVDGKIFWKEVQGNVISDTEKPLEVLSTSQEEFEQFSNIGDNVISFVENKIYKGNKLISSLFLDDLKLNKAFSYEDLTFSSNDTLQDIISKIINYSITKWNDSPYKVKFEKTTINNFKQLEKDENTFYKVGNKLYIGSDLMTTVIEWEDIDAVLESYQQDLLFK